jgi:hypothetical protein
VNKIIIRNGEMYRLAYPDILVWDKDSDDWLCCSPISSLDPCDQDEMRTVMRCLDYPINMLKVLTDMLNAFYEKHGLEHLCAFESKLVGNYNDDDQLEWLDNFNYLWQRASDRHYRLKEKYRETARKVSYLNK